MPGQGVTTAEAQANAVKGQKQTKLATAKGVIVAEAQAAAVENSTYV